MPDIQSFRPPFSKGGAVKGAEPLSPIAMGETPPILPKTQERVNFFACKERGRTLVGGSPFLFVFVVGGRTLLERRVGSADSQTNLAYIKFRKTHPWHNFYDTFLPHTP